MASLTPKPQIWQLVEKFSHLPNRFGGGGGSTQVVSLTAFSQFFFNAYSNVIFKKITLAPSSDISSQSFSLSTFSTTPWTKQNHTTLHPRGHLEEDVHLKPHHSQFNLGFSKLLSPYFFSLLPRWICETYKICVLLINYLPSFIQLGNRDLEEWL